MKFKHSLLNLFVMLFVLSILVSCDTEIQSDISREANVEQQQAEE